MLDHDPDQGSERPRVTAIWPSYNDKFRDFHMSWKLIEIGFGSLLPIGLNQILLLIMDT